MQGWCKTNYHADGKRRYGLLTNGLCNDCWNKKLLPTTPKKSISLENSNLEHTSMEKIQQIIQQINQTNQSASMIARKGLCEIDELGGYRILGYDTDKEYLKAEFPQLDISQLSRQRSCGRIEKILGLPIGTYSYNKLLPLLQFRILVPCGRTGKNKGIFPKSETINQPFKENPEGIAKVKQAYQIAQKLAEKSGQFSGIPEGKYIEESVNIMAEKGLAKKRLSPYKKEIARKNKEWLIIISQKDQEINLLQARIHELETTLKILSKHEINSNLSKINHSSLPLLIDR